MGKTPDLIVCDEVRNYALHLLVAEVVASVTAGLLLSGAQAHAVKHSYYTALTVRGPCTDQAINPSVSDLIY